MSSETFISKLIAQIQEKKSIVCIGLDPRLEGSQCIPDFIQKEEKNANDAIWRFNKDLIDATHDLAAIYKPQMAFYEKYNALDALKKTIDYIHQKKSLAILDAKRNDIGSTSLAYAETIFNYFQADAVTINSYLGIDGVLPFLEYFTHGKGVILLIKTSNPSSGEFQDLFSVALPDQSPEITEIQVEKIQLVRNYIQMTRLMKKWAKNHDKLHECGPNDFKYSNIGGVVGATYPKQLETIRNEAPEHFMLIPGYGAQGGTAQDIVYGVNVDGLGAIVNASRSINFAYQRDPYKDQFTAQEYYKAARQAALDMRDDINKALKDSGKIAY